MNMMKVFGQIGSNMIKTLTGVKGSVNKTISLGKEYGINIKVPKFSKDILRNLRWAGRGAGGITGGILGTGFGTAAGGPIGGVVGGAVGSIVGGTGTWATSKIAKGAFFGALKYPKTTFGLGLTGISTYSFAKPILGEALANQKTNRPTNPAVSRHVVGPGFVQFGNSPRVQMPANNIGATGDLTLSLYKKRHK